MKSNQQNSPLFPLWIIGKNLFFPVFLFFFFLFFLLSKDELIEKFLGNASSLVEIGFSYGSQIGMWLSGAFLFQRVITVFFWDGLIAGISGRPVPRLPKDVTAMLLFCISIMGVLATVFEQSVTGIWATSGVFGIVVGIALRNVILDVFIGLSMHVEQPFRIGDWVMVHQNRRETHIIGQVIEINWRTTRLKTTEKNMIVVPNSRMGETILTNYMKPKPHFRVDLEYVLDYSVPPNRAIRILTAAIHSLVDDEKFLSKPEPEIRLHKSFSHGQGYEVRYFILPVNISPNESKHMAGKAILEHLIKGGLTPSVSKEKIFLDKEMDYAQKAVSEEMKPSFVPSDYDLFSMLSENEILNLRKKEKKVELLAGEELYPEGVEEDVLYIVAEGLLQSFHSLQGTDETLRIDQLPPGSQLGEDCVMGRQLRSSSVKAVSDAILFAYPGEAVRSIAKGNGKFLSFLNQKLTLRKGRISRSKWESDARKKAPKKSKSSVKQTLQTFFSDLFPDSNSPKTEPS